MLFVNYVKNLYVYVYYKYSVKYNLKLKEKIYYKTILIIKKYFAINNVK